MDPLSKPRADIDRLDRELVRLLAERLDAVRAIGSAKGRDPSAPLRDAERERNLFATWARTAEEHGVSSYEREVQKHAKNPDFSRSNSQRTDANDSNVNRNNKTNRRKLNMKLNRPGMRA